jgi:hypothetical protein
MNDNVDLSTKLSRVNQYVNKKKKILKEDDQMIYFQRNAHSASSEVRVERSPSFAKSN